MLNKLTVVELNAEMMAIRSRVFIEAATKEDDGSTFHEQRQADGERGYLEWAAGLIEHDEFLNTPETPAPANVETCEKRRQMSTLAPAAPSFTTFTEFTPGKHLQCAVCGFEAIYTDARRRTVSYVITDGLTVDAATTERDSTVKQSDISGISCNRTGCDWTGPALLPAGYAAAVEIENGWYRWYVTMSDAWIDRPDRYGECLRYIVKSAESLEKLQAWAADPAQYDFSELAGVTA